jgi:hypothetical protein
MSGLEIDCCPSDIQYQFDAGRRSPAWLLAAMYSA